MIKELQLLRSVLLELSDGDCAYCGNHYSRHRKDCKLAMALIATATEQEPYHGKFEEK